MPRPISERPGDEAEQARAGQKEALEVEGGTTSSRRLSMNLSDSATPRTPIGTLIQKIQRQWK